MQARDGYDRHFDRETTVSCRRRPRSRRMKRRIDEKEREQERERRGKLGRAGE